MREPTNHEPLPGSQDGATDSRHGTHEPVERSGDEADRLGAGTPGPLHRRVAAFLIDSALGFGVALLYSGFTGFQVASQLYIGGAEEEEILDLSRSTSESFWATLAVVAAIAFFYRWSTQSAFGWTPGKRLLGLRVVGSDRGLARQQSVLVREIALAPGAVFALLSIDYILAVLALPTVAPTARGLGPLNFVLPLAMMAFTFWRLDRRGLHDLIGGTLVTPAALSPKPGPASKDVSLLPRRVLAFAIDFLIGLVVIFAAGIALGGVAMISAIVLPVLNRVMLPATLGFTIGKRVMGLRIVGSDGGRAWWVQILVRECLLLVLLYGANLVTILGGWAPATGLVALILLYIAIQRTDRRSLHDLASGTCVVRSSAVGGDEAASRGLSPQV